MIRQNETDYIGPFVQSSNTYNYIVISPAFWTRLKRPFSNLSRISEEIKQNIFFELAMFDEAAFSFSAAVRLGVFCHFISLFFNASKQKNYIPQI